MINLAFPTLIYSNKLWFRPNNSQTAKKKKKTILNAETLIKKPAYNLAKIELEALLDDCENLLMTDQLGHEWSKKNYKEGYTSYGSLDRLHTHLTSFKKLEKALSEHLDQYIKDLDYDIQPTQDLTLTHMWINVMPSGAQHTSHLHPLSVISGTVYLQVPKNSSAIKFEDPKLSHLMNAPSQKLKARYPRFIELYPQAGDVILFESWLRHEVPRNSSTDPRISVSFNYGWKK